MREIFKVDILVHQLPKY